MVLHSLGSNLIRTLIYKYINKKTQCVSKLQATIYYTVLQEFMSNNIFLSLVCLSRQQTKLNPSRSMLLYRASKSLCMAC